VPNHLKSVFEIKVEKSMNKKYVAIATILIFLVIIGLMIMRGRKDRYEGDEASELLTEIKDQLQSIGTLWAKIKNCQRRYQRNEVQPRIDQKPTRHSKENIR
jgi:hypothetical protein